MMSAASYALFSTTVWMDPVNVGELFVVPVTSITYTKQNEHKIMWQASKYLQDNFNNVQTAFKSMFERIIDPS